MTRLEDFERLAERARSEPAPTPDVTAAVVRRLAALEAPPSLAVPVGFAAACACAALVLGYYGLQAWTSLGDYWLGPVLSDGGWWLK